MDLSHYTEPKPHYGKRIAWFITYNLLFRWLIGGRLRYVRNLLLRAFGARIPLGSMVYHSTRIWAPWNLSVGRYSCVGPRVELYNRAPITIGDNAIVSQGAFLCTASHDFNDPRHPLITAPIRIGDQAWVAAEAYVGMGVTIGEGAVVGARGSVYKDVEPWTIVGGNPAKFIKRREIQTP